MKNYEMIRNMSIDELAGAITCPKTMLDIEEDMQCWFYQGISCEECCKAWLEREAKNAP